jgi:predicted porin
MNKKLIAVAVAGLFAAPTAALAQSSVTISGLLKGGFESMKYSSSSKANASQTGVVDDASRIVFNVVEDLGGGLQAIGQLDMRVKPDDQGATPAAPTGAQNTGNLISGNSHFGLRSKDWGRIFFGRQDLHYFNTESNIADKGSLRASSVSLLSFIGALPIANASRTQNVVHYTTPNWSGFTLIAAYSSNPGGPEADISSGTRKGSAWNLNPNFAAANWQVGYSYWKSKPDATANADQRADRLYGSYVFPMGLKIGLAWDKSKIQSTTGGGDVARRSAWSLPVSYNWGNHTIHANYSKARDEQVAAGDQGASMWALAYSYDLSKRTSAAFTYARINNKTLGTYNFFTAGSLGIANAPVAAGEDPRMWGFTLRHAF